MIDLSIASGLLYYPVSIVTPRPSDILMQNSGYVLQENGDLIAME